MSSRYLYKEKRLPPDWFRRAHPALLSEKEQEKRNARVIGRYRKNSLLLQAGVFLLVLLLWRLPIPNPVKLLVVLFHESSHCAAAVLTGGHVYGIAIDPGGAGVSVGYGGNVGLILMAGYAGSLLIGATLYVLSSVWEPWEVWGALLGFCALSLLAGWLNDFTAIFGYGAFIMILVGFSFLDSVLKKACLRFVATCCCLYPVIDVLYEALNKNPDGFRLNGEVVGSDVHRFAAVTGASPWALGIFWCGLGTLLAFWLIWWSAKRDAQDKAKICLFRPKLRMKFEHHIYDSQAPDDLPVYRVR